MHLLFETPAGYAIFKLLDESKLELSDVAASFSTVEKAQSVLVPLILYFYVLYFDFRVQLHAFHPFEDTTEAVVAATSLVQSELSSDLAKFLKKKLVKVSLNV